MTNLRVCAVSFLVSVVFIAGPVTSQDACGIPNCSTCNADNVCTDCIGLFLINNDVTPPVCAPMCNAIPNCRRCPNGQCEVCHPLHGLNLEGLYPRCDRCDNYKGCHNCKSVKLCDQCEYPASLGPDQDGVATCSPCGRNCRYCGVNGGGLCDICESGSATPVNKQCVCAENCDVCKRAGYTKCDTCKTGYGVTSDNLCGVCDPKCNSCALAGAGKCDPNSCVSGYSVNSDGVCAVPVAPNCPQNCKECNKGLCSKCDPTFKLSADKTTCIPKKEEN